jgi:serine protease Do
MPQQSRSGTLSLSAWLLGGVLVVATSFASVAGLSKGPKLPVDVDVAIYLPEHLHKAQSAYAGIGTVQVGSTVSESVLSVGQAYFSSSHLVDTGTDTHYGLLVAIHVHSRMSNGSLVYTMDYSVFGPDKQSLLKGSQSATQSMQELRAGGDVIGRVTQQVAELAMTDIVTKLQPNQARFPATGSVGPQSLGFVANHDEPWVTGTGFYINAVGEVMTAAHVTRDCLELQVYRDQQVFPGKVVASSDLVDLAVVDTGTPAAKFLPLRRGTSYELGEAVTNVGYPLQPLLSASPNLTRGNVSSRGGLSGSVGQFQFSAPIQPGSSGGPVVSDGGELIGITVSTLGAAAAFRQGVLPQNVNFALDARYAEMFLQKNNIVFTSVEPNLKGDSRTANEAALSAVVGVRCYE